MLFVWSVNYINLDDKLSTSCEAKKDERNERRMQPTKVQEGYNHHYIPSLFLIGVN